MAEQSEVVRGLRVIRNPNPPAIFGYRLSSRYHTHGFGVRLWPDGKALITVTNYNFRERSWEDAYEPYKTLYS